MCPDRILRYSCHPSFGPFWSLQVFALLVRCLGLTCFLVFRARIFSESEAGFRVYFLHPVYVLAV